MGYEFLCVQLHKTHNTCGRVRGCVRGCALMHQSRRICRCMSPNCVQVVQAVSLIDARNGYACCKGQEQHTIRRGLGTGTAACLRCRADRGQPTGPGKAAACRCVAGQKHCWPGTVTNALVNPAHVRALCRKLRVAQSCGWLQFGVGQDLLGRTVCNMSRDK